MTAVIIKDIRKRSVRPAKPTSAPKVPTPTPPPGGNTAGPISLRFESERGNPLGFVDPAKKRPSEAILIATELRDYWAPVFRHVRNAVREAWTYLKAWRLNPSADPLMMREAQANLELWEADPKFAKSLGVRPHHRHDDGIIIDEKTRWRRDGCIQTIYCLADGTELFGMWRNPDGSFREPHAGEIVEVPPGVNYSEFRLRQMDA